MLCVDDHPVVREGVSLIIEMQPDMHVVGTAATGEEAVVVFREQRPDVTLMDLQLPGIRAIRWFEEMT